MFEPRSAIAAATTSPQFLSPWVAYLPEARGAGVNMIEEPLELTDLVISLRLDGRVPQKVYLAPSQEALDFADVKIEQIDHIGVTYGPGLVGALLVGLSTAKAMAYALGIPLVGVNHIEGHICANYIEHRNLKPPFLCLIVSGGHTLLILMRGLGQYEPLGSTVDDAAGEAFDKVAKFLDLGYPGGVVIDELARSGNPSAISFPRAYLEKDSLDFSFSGIKTAVVNFVRKYVDSNQGGSIDISENNVDMTKQLPVQLADIAASFQEAVVDVLVIKTCAAAQRFDARQVVVAGGVAANSRLRERLREEVTRLGLPLMLPKAELCTDNAAMVAAAGFHQYKKTGGRWDLDFDAISRWPDKTAGS